jgi:hypothetical protein|tara:strand:- start:334 stop:642 length:309 start_codon:yes stop_codon:yes gene_type:complete
MNMNERIMNMITNLTIPNFTEGFTKEQIEQNIEMFTQQQENAIVNLYENKRETLAFNESGNKQGYEERLEDTDFFTVYDFLNCYSVVGFTDEQVEEIIQRYS